LAYRLFLCTAGGLFEILHGTRRKWITGNYMGAARKIQGKLRFLYPTAPGLNLEKREK